MRTFFKCLGILFTGIFVASFFYPLIHEGGHVITAKFVGAEVIGINIAGQPYVLCEFADYNCVDMVVVGLGGMLFPLLITMLCHSEIFWIWYGAFLMQCICALSFAISFISIILHNFGFVVENEDIIKVLSVWGDGKHILAMLMLFLLCVVLLMIVRQKPVQKILEFFDCF